MKEVKGTGTVQEIGPRGSGYFHCGECHGRNFFIRGDDAFCSHCGGFILNIAIRYRGDQEMDTIIEEIEADGGKNN